MREINEGLADLIGAHAGMLELAGSWIRPDEMVYRFHEAFHKEVPQFNPTTKIQPLHTRDRELRIAMPTGETSAFVAPVHTFGARLRTDFDGRSMRFFGKLFHVSRWIALGWELYPITIDPMLSATRPANAFMQRLEIKMMGWSYHAESNSPGELYVRYAYWAHGDTLYINVMSR